MESGIYKYLITKDGDLESAVEDMTLDYEISIVAYNYGLNDKPKDYPYIVLMHPDDEYGRIDYAFVSANDFFTPDDQPGSLSELRNKIYSYATMKPWIERIEESAINGETELVFEDIDDTPNFTNERQLNNSQAKWLRDRGYTVSWEKYLRRWIVSGWTN